MRAFVAGATGYTGRALVYHLVSLGVKTYAHVRPDSPQRQEWCERFQAAGAEVNTSAWNALEMSAALKEIEPHLVFSVLGTTARRARRELAPGAKPYEVVDFSLSHLLLQACEASLEGAVFVYLSAMGVRANTTNSYLQARARMEEALACSSIRALIARPALVSGPDRGEFRPLERIATVSLDGLLALLRCFGVNAPARRYTSLTGDALARGMIFHALHLLAQNGVATDRPAVDGASTSGERGPRYFDAGALRDGGLEFDEGRLSRLIDEYQCGA